LDVIRRHSGDIVAADDVAIEPPSLEPKVV
jgi:hypothetical protein